MADPKNGTRMNADWADFRGSSQQKGEQKVGLLLLAFAWL
jgi:hypothetical protein